MTTKLRISFTLLQRKYVICRIKIGVTKDQFLTGLQAEHPEKWINGEPTGRGFLENKLRNALQELKDKLETLFTEHPIETAAELKELHKTGTPPQRLPEGTPNTLLQAFEFMMKAKSMADEHEENTRDYYVKMKNSVSGFLESIGLEDIMITRFTKEHIRNYYQWLKQSGVDSEYSRYQYCTSISTAINFLIKEYSDVPGSIKLNHIKGTIKRPSKKKMKAKSRKNFLPAYVEKNIEQTEMIGTTRYLPKEWWKWTALFQMNTGFSFVDLGNDHWEIINTIKGAVIEIYRVKSLEPCTIPILPDTQKCLDKLKSFQEAHDHDRLFPIRKFVSNNNIDQDMKIYDADYKNYQNFLRQLRTECGSIVPIKSHTLRHSFGMKMLNQYGFSLDEVSMMLGHESLRTTEDIYAYVSRDRILNKMEQLGFGS